MPVCTVLLPEEEDFSLFLNRAGEVRQKGLAGLGSVYEDLRILQLTRDIVAQAPSIEIPRDNRRLVETATHPEALSAFQHGRWQEHYQHLTGVCIRLENEADGACIPNKHFGDFVFRDPDLGPVTTRLGLNDRRLTLGGAFISPFGRTIDEINLPGHLAKGLEAEQAHLVSLEGDSLLIQADPLGQFVYRYTRFGLEKIDEPAR